MRSSDAARTRPRQSTASKTATDSESPNSDALGVDQLSLRPGSVLGRYVILSQLGAGGMGVVYRAHDPQLNRDVAIKLISTHAPNKDLPTQPIAWARKALLKEARAAAAVEHSNVTPIYDVGTDGDQLFITMELVAGQNLREVIRQGRVKWETAQRIIIDIAKGRVL